MSSTDLCPTCGGDCGTSECESLAEAQTEAQAQGFDDWDDEPCDHDHDEDCYDYQGFLGFLACTHTHCWNCGGCGCPGYCDDHQTYNLRPAETGGATGEEIAATPKENASEQ